MCTGATHLPFRSSASKSTKAGPEQRPPDMVQQRNSAHHHPLGHLLFRKGQHGPRYGAGKPTTPSLDLILHFPELSSMLMSYHGAWLTCQ
ncbi:MAG: hypothetical protein IPP90_16415 [Gemmatimonadaceae bacterium]|nr:hypothetical protein [Gemmatimonadaceae bacterium]